VQAFSETGSLPILSELPITDVDALTGARVEVGWADPFIAESLRISFSKQRRSTMSSQTGDPGSRLAQILALENLDGVGRVTARKILDQFGSLDEVRRFPREQIMNRLRRVPQAAKLVDRLLDEKFIAESVAAAEQTIEELEGKHLVALTSGDDGWPEELDGLPNAHRPNVLFGYGNLKLLAEPSVAMLGTAPVTTGPFEAAQVLVRRLAGAGTIVSSSASDGLDNVIIKILLSTDTLPMLVAQCGLARVAPELRPSVSAVVKQGGLLVSSFHMQHGPFDHDNRERMLVQAALSKATVFIEPREGGFSWDAMQWSLDQGKPVFALSSEPLPERVHVIHDELDMDWVLAAMRHVPE
jgi:DNA processing protein